VSATLAAQASSSSSPWTTDRRVYTLHARAPRIPRSPAFPHQAFISTGASASAVAPDASLELVLDRMRPLLRDGALDAALLGAARDIGEVVSGRLAPRTPYLAWFLILLAIVALLVYQRWAAERRAKSYRDVMRTLSKLEADAARARAKRYAATSCPICFDDFAPDAPEPAEAAAGGDSGGAEGAPAGGSEAPPHEDASAAPTGVAKSLLPCGHAFCAPCLARALAVKPACPICRAPADGTPAPRPPPPPPCDGGAAAGADIEAYRPELAFRLNQLHLAHPEVVTLNMAERWASHAHAGGFTNDAALLRADPARAPPPRPTGGGGGGGGSGGGSSGHFGGGSSAGGSGRGGGW
jgi:uncharacterized membrane protein YgcG